MSESTMDAHYINVLFLIMYTQATMTFILATVFMQYSFAVTISLRRSLCNRMWLLYAVQMVSTVITVPESNLFTFFQDSNFLLF
jgi:hypothetical protein